MFSPSSKGLAAWLIRDPLCLRRPASAYKHFNKFGDIPKDPIERSDHSGFHLAASAEVVPMNIEQRRGERRDASL